MSYSVITQTAVEVGDLDQAPALSIPAYLVLRGEEHLLRVISVYSARGDSAEAVRILYMNEAALTIWRAMGRTPTIIGARHRPPTDAMLTFGVPFSS